MATSIRGSSLAQAPRLSGPGSQARSPAPAALAIHLVAWAGILGLRLLIGPFPPVWACLAEGGIAGLVSRRLGLPLWWQAINGLFFPLAWLVAQAEADPRWFLTAFVLLALTSLGSVRTRVPLWLSGRQVPVALARCLPQRPGLRVIDLGCGLGGPLAGLARLRPDISLSGVEAAPLNWCISRLRLGRRANIRLGSLWDEDLSRYDLVYVYLSPAPMARLWEKACREMRPGTFFVSNGFPVPGHAPDEVIELPDAHRSRLLLWSMG